MLLGCIPQGVSLVARQHVCAQKYRVWIFYMFSVFNPSLHLHHTPVYVVCGRHGAKGCCVRTPFYCSKVERGNKGEENTNTMHSFCEYLAQGCRSNYVAMGMWSSNAQSGSKQQR